MRWARGDVAATLYRGELFVGAIEAGDDHRAQLCDLVTEERAVVPIVGLRRPTIEEVRRRVKAREDVDALRAEWRADMAAQP